MATRHRHHHPNPEQVLKLLMGVLDDVLPTGGQRVPRLKPTATNKEVASLLNITQEQVKRIVKAFKEGGLPAAKALKWGAGRPCKKMDFRPEEIERMVSR